MWYQGDGCASGFGPWFPGHGLVGLGLNIVIVVAVLLLLFRLFRSGTSAPRDNRDARDSLALLDRRLAEGKIDREEYQRIRDILGG